MNTTTKQDRTVIVKVGTDVMLGKSGCLDKLFLAGLVDQLMQVKKQVHRIILVTSGAVATGYEACGEQRGASASLDELQDRAVIGQPILMETYRSALRMYDCLCGQLLLTKSNFAVGNERVGLERYSIKQRIEFMLQKGRRILPICNENDPIESEEMFTDNDDVV